MKTDDFDVIVVGAGIAGLCCAGELVLRGARPLLICESKEVGYLYRSAWIGKNRCLMQHPARQASWGGGWWFGLARRLNIPLKLYSSFREFRIGTRGSNVVHDLPVCVSASAVVDAMAQFSPLPIGENRAGMEKVLGAALAIPYQELCNMQEVPLVKWLADQGADEFVSMMMLAIGANFIELKMDQARERLSVFGSIGPLRAWMCGEGEQWNAFPDAREGLCIPLAQEVERRGGKVLRGQKVKRVLIEGDRAVGVELEDGSKIKAPKVALASGTGRVGKLLDRLPDEIVKCIEYEKTIEGLEDFTSFSLLDKPVDVDPRKFMFLINPDGSSLQCTFSLQTVAPWTTEPGKFLLGAEVILSREEVDELGGADGVFANMEAINEEMHPGYTKALLETATLRHPHWAGPNLCGPKLPRTIDSLKNLWFVGEGSAPVGGLYVDLSASTGIMGAQDMFPDK